MTNILILLLTAASFAHAKMYDRCPEPMKLVGKDCVYYAGNLIDPTFDCGSLLGKFGLLDCSKSAGKMCDEWGVGACKDLMNTCSKYRDPKYVKRFKGEDLKAAKATEDYCKNSYFVITDPENKPTPAESPEKVKADQQGYDFHGALILYDAAKKKEDADRAANIPYAGDVLCPIPEFTQALPEVYKRCLDRKDLESNTWTNVNSRTWPFYKNGIQHRLRKKDGYLEIALNILLQYEGDEKDRDYVLGRIWKARSCVDKFFLNHRIKLNLGLSSDSKSWAAWWKADIYNIKVSKFVDTINSKHWATSMRFGNGPADLNDSELCGTIIHELAHRLGIPDRYYLNTPYFARDKKTIMHDGNWLLPYAYFTEEDLKILSKPLCNYDRFPAQVLPVPKPAPTPLPKN